MTLSVMAHCAHLIICEHCPLVTFADAVACMVSYYLHDQAPANMSMGAA